MFSRACLFTAFLLASALEYTSGFQPSISLVSQKPKTAALYATSPPSISTKDRQDVLERVKTDAAGWDKLAEIFVSSDYRSDVNEVRTFAQLVTLFRVGVPALLVGALVGVAYPSLSMTVFYWINDAKALDVIANDYSQYIQNTLTTSGLMFTITIGYTYYFLYQQQEAIYLAMFQEVAEAKCLLEQVSLVSQGREEMYQDLLDCVERYVNEDLTQFCVQPSILLSRRPIDDPLEEIMYITSVGEPSIVYQTVRSLRQARAYRLGALQRKLPPIHFVLVYSLATVILVVFPVLGAGSSTIGGDEILKVQGVYMSFIVFGIVMTLGVLGELVEPAGKGAYNVVGVLDVMVKGLCEELDGRQEGKFVANLQSPTSDSMGPTDDSVLFYDGVEVDRYEEE